MKSRKELNDSIFLTTKKIREEFPELLKYLNEIPERVITNMSSEINIKELEGYLNSLNELLVHYTKEEDRN
jgi:hypothetical protein